MSKINAVGRKEAERFIRQHHRNPESVNLDAYLQDALFQLAEGNQPAFELSRYHSKSGATVECVISDAGVTA